MDAEPLGSAVASSSRCSRTSAWRPEPRESAADEQRTEPPFSVLPAAPHRSLPPPTLPQPPLPPPPRKMVPAAGRGEWRLPPARGGGGGSGHLRGRPGGTLRSGCRGGGPDRWALSGLRRSLEKLARAFGAPLAGCLLPRPPWEIGKVSGFLGVRLSARSGQESPPRARGTGLRGASCLHPLLFGFQPRRPRHSPSCCWPPPPRRVVTLRAAVPGTLSPRPGRVTL